MVDTGGPTGRSKGELFATKPAAAADVKPSNSLHVVAAGIGAASVDGSRARVGFAKRRLTIRATTDAPLQLRLTRLATARGVLLIDGKRMRTVRTRSGTVTVTAPAGTPRWCSNG